MVKAFYIFIPESGNIQEKIIISALVIADCLIEPTQGSAEQM